MNLSSPEIRRDLIVALLLALVTLAIYGPTVRHDFINYDDGGYIYRNPQVQAGLTKTGLIWALTAFTESNWHPLTWLSHMLDCQLFGLRPGWHHLVSVLFHVANSILLFWVLKRMTAAPWRSAMTAALFALHPMHVESVAWAAERKDVLSTLFWMLTMGAYARYAEHSGMTRYLPVAAFLALGLMSKPMLVTLPLVLLLLDYWPLARIRVGKGAASARQRSGSPAKEAERGKSLGRLVVEKLPLLVLAIGSCLVTVVAQSAGGALTPVERLSLHDRVANALMAYLKYIGMAFWPAGLAVYYPYPTALPAWQWIGAAMTLAVVSAVVLWQRRRRRYLLGGWLWFLGTLVPVIGVVQVGTQAMADRYTYIPYVGLFLAVVWGLAELAAARELHSLNVGRGGRPRPDRRRAEPGVAHPGVVGWFRSQGVLPLRMGIIAMSIAAVFGCAVTAWFQVSCWRNSITLFEHSLEVTAGSDVAQDSLGLALMAQRRPKEAIMHYREALRINPFFGPTHYNLGNALEAVGKPDEAIESYRTSLRLRPDLLRARERLVTVLLGAGKRDEAVDQCRLFLRDAPNHHEVRLLLAKALMAQGKTDEAITELQSLLRIHPGQSEVQGLLALAFAELGNALMDQGRNEDAIVRLRESLGLNPAQADVHATLGRSLARAGRNREAIAEYREALRLAPDHLAGLNNLAWVLATSPDSSPGDVAEAVHLAERASHLSGRKDPNCLDTLAAAYAAAGRFPDAIRTGQEGLNLAASSKAYEVAAEIRGHLQQYREGHAYHETAAAQKEVPRK